jgi:hypothetical protein
MMRIQMAFDMAQNPLPSSLVDCTIFTANYWVAASMALVHSVDFLLSAYFSSKMKLG